MLSLFIAASELGVGANAYEKMPDGCKGKDWDDRSCYPKKAVDGTQALAMATYLDTIDSSDVVVVAAPRGSQFEMGSKAMDALKLVGVTPLEVATLTPWERLRTFRDQQSKQQYFA